MTLSDPAREAASRLIIQDFRGRMKPLDTLAREMVMKISKSNRQGHHNPVDQYLSWSLNPSFWWDKPLIAVRFPGLKDLLGVPTSRSPTSPWPAWWTRAATTSCPRPWTTPTARRTASAPSCSASSSASTSAPTC